MDKVLQLLKRHVASCPSDVESLHKYIHALERLHNAEANPEPIKLYLLSSEGERHEDRLPSAIFTTVQAARDFVQAYGNDYWTGETPITVTESSHHHGDYGDYIRFWCGVGEDTDEVIGFMLDSFEVNPEGPGTVALEFLEGLH
jgi:hypothetical protein